MAAAGVVCLGLGGVQRAYDPQGPWWMGPGVYGVMIVQCWATELLRRERAWAEARKAGGTVVDVTEAGITFDVGGERTFLQWHAFTHYRETPALFLLFHDRTTFRFIPRSAFAAQPGAVPEFRRLLHARVRLTRFAPRHSAAPGFPLEPPVARS